MAYHTAMADGDPQVDRLEKLRRWKVRPERDLSLQFLRSQFRREVEKPFHQLEAIAPLWRQLVGAQLAGHSCPESFSRGVLRVAVDSSSRLYELDRLLRGGLEKQLAREHKGAALNRVRLRVDVSRFTDGSERPEQRGQDDGHDDDQ
jgi:predicted nucleic acid-binding Zn ribbon protein